MSKPWRVIFALFLAPALLAVSSFAAASAGQINISDLTVREMLPGSKVTSAYFALTNHSEQPVTLTSVSSALSKRIEIHQHTMKNGLMKMSHVKGGVVIKPHDTLRFVAGGYHLMVFNPLSKVKKGEAVELTFHVKQADAASNTVSSTIKASGKVVSVLDEQQAKKQHHHH
ncbi:MAG: copper(I)-binding protein [Phenylobacterium sp.]|jgi:copper(I)-binding protein